MSIQNQFKLATMEMCHAPDGQVYEGKSADIKSALERGSEFTPADPNSNLTCG